MLAMTPDATPGNPPSSMALGLLVVSAAMVNPLAMTALLSVLPAITAEFSTVPHAPALVRGLVSIVAVALVFAAPFAANLAERFGMRRVMMGSAAIFVISGMSGFVIDNLWLLFASRAVLGIADAFIGTLTIAHIAATLDPRRKARWIGWYTFAAAAGAFIIIPLSGALGRSGWQNVFLLYAMALPILFAAALVIGPEQGKKDRSVATTKGARPDKTWLTRLPLAIVAIGLVSGAVENTTHVFLPFRLHDLGVTAPDRIANAVLPIAVGGAASAFCYGFLRDRMSIATIFAVSFAWGGVSLLWIGQAESYEAIIVAGISLGLGVGLLAPNANAYAADSGGPAEAARAVGYARGAFFAGSPAAQALLEPVAAGSGAGSAISALGILSILLAIGTCLLLKLQAGGTDLSVRMAKQTTKKDA